MCPLPTEWGNSAKSRSCLGCLHWWKLQKESKRFNISKNIFGKYTSFYKDRLSFFFFFPVYPEKKRDLKTHLLCWCKINTLRNKNFFKHLTSFLCIAINKKWKESTLWSATVFSKGVLPLTASSGLGNKGHPSPWELHRCWETHSHVSPAVL